MTTTDLLTAQSVGTGANHGTALYAAQLALQAATAGLIVTAQLTAGTGAQPDAKQRIRVWFATSPFNVSTFIASQFETDAKFFEVNTPVGSAQIKVATSEFVINQGGYLYWWVEAPVLPVAGSLNLKCVEI